MSSLTDKEGILLLGFGGILFLAFCLLIDGGRLL